MATIDCGKCLSKKKKDSVAALLPNDHLQNTHRDPETFKVPLPVCIRKTNNTMREGMYTATRELLQPPEKSRFEEFDIDVRESVYKSKQDMMLGQPRKSLHKPPDVTNVSQTFGAVTPAAIPLYELVLPSNVPKEVKESWSSFDHGRKTYPYNEHFQGDQTFGDHYDVDPAGRCTRKCLDWMYDPDEPCVINNVQGDFRNRTQTEDGKGLEPLKNRLYRPPDHTYGYVPCHKSGSVAEHLVECEVCPKKKEILSAVAQLNRVRYSLRKKDINFFNVHAIVRTFDQNGTHELHKDMVYLLLCKQHIQFDPAKLEPLLKFVGIVDEASGQMKYDEFIDMLNILKPYPILDKIQDVPQEHLHYTSTYAALLEDAKKPFVKNVRQERSVHPCDRTNVATLLAPNECIRNGLFHNDYLVGRSRDVIRAIFHTSGLYQMTDEEFDAAFTECCRRDEARGGYDMAGLVCVETFKNYLDSK